MNYKQAIESINGFVKQFDFFEFSIYSYSHENLVIVGSPDMAYYHNIEIHLKGCFYIASKMNWIANAGKVVDGMDESEELEYNMGNKIEVGNYTVKFLDRDGLTYYYSFAEIDVVEKTVKYYD